MDLAPDPEEHDLAPLDRPPPVRSWSQRLELIADATGSTPGRLVVGAVLLVVAVAGGMWLTRPPADPVEAALPFASTTLVAEAPASTPPTTEAAVAVVHVAGAVRAPGVYELAAGARVVDAVEAAGGLAAGADAARLNLAAPVADGERVYVTAVGEEPPAAAGPSPSGAGGEAGSSSGPVDLNTADAAALEALPGVGPATAAAILEHRERIGRFSSVEQLLDVPGIGEAKLAALRDLVRV